MPWRTPVAISVACTLFLIGLSSTPRQTESPVQGIEFSLLEEDRSETYSHLATKFQAAAVVDNEQAKEAEKARQWLSKNVDRTDRKDLFKLSSSLRAAADQVRKATHSRGGGGVDSVQENRKAQPAGNSVWTILQPATFDKEELEALRKLSASRGGVPARDIFPAFAGPTFKSHLANAIGNLILPFQAL